jgi:SpoIID/LytB domain protein
MAANSGAMNSTVATPAQVDRNSPIHQDKLLPKHDPAAKAPEPYQPGPAWGASTGEKFTEIRVKIFPHNSSHTQPQGPEGSQSSVTLQTSGKCETRAATSSSAGPMGAKLKDLTPGKLLLTADKLDKPFWLVCDQPVKVLRVKEKIIPLAYRGRLFIKKAGASLTIVDVLPLEDYVNGVVPSEMPYSWHIEALKAQAIAARTYALFNLAANVASSDAAIQREQSGAQLDDTVEYQAYLGASSEGPASNQAVAATRGQVITYKGSIIDAFFHADSGGHTEDAANVWGDTIPYAVGKAEMFPYALVKDGAWTVTSKLSKLQASLTSGGELSAAAAPLSGVAVLEDDLNVSGRAHHVTLQMGALSKKVHGRKFQSALGLHSNLIVPTMNGDTVKVAGRGFGHGVGMSQCGARVMADHYRKTAEEILKFYYTGVEVTPVK